MAVVRATSAICLASVAVFFASSATINESPDSTEGVIIAEGALGAFDVIITLSSDLRCLIQFFREMAGTARVIVLNSPMSIRIRFLHIDQRPLRSP